MRYPFTEPLPGLADLSAFLEQDHVNSLLRKQDPRRALHGGHEAKIHSSGSEMFLRPSKHVWAYSGTYWTHS